MVEIATEIAKESKESKIEPDSDKESKQNRFKGANLIFYLTIASLTMPSVLVSLGIGIVFQVLKIDTNWFSSGLGAHLTRTVPFAFLIMLGVFNRTGAGFSPYCGGSIITSIHKTTSESIFQG